MFTALFRFFWRTIIFIIGSFGAGVIVFKIFPYVDKKLPVYVALLATYCLIAYVFIPTMIRLFRLVIKPNHIPLYVTTSDGWPSDPVNIAIVVKNRSQLVGAMSKAGWYEAEPMTFRRGIKEVISMLFNKPYPAAPLSSLYLFNRAQDIGFEIPTNLAMSARTRHHVRFWRLQDVPSRKGTHYHQTFWFHKLKHLFGVDKQVWIGAATEETHPIDIQWYTGRLTHGGNHDSNRERDFIIQSLKDAKMVSSVHQSEAGEIVKFRGQQFRTMYVSDGSLKIARIKNKIV